MREAGKQDSEEAFPKSPFNFTCDEIVSTKWTPKILYLVVGSEHNEDNRQEDEAVEETEDDGEEEYLKLRG